jgi:hypothetical protein
MKAYCPTDNTHRTFVTVAHVTEDWVVDPDGNFLYTQDDSPHEVVADPSMDNIWYCSICGAEAVFREPNSARTFKFNYPVEVTVYDDDIEVTQDMVDKLIRSAFDLPIKKEGLGHPMWTKKMYFNEWVVRY